MKVRCIVKIGKPIYQYEIYYGDVMYGEIYDVISIEKGSYRIIDASGEDYLYPPELFEIIEE